MSLYTTWRSLSENHNSQEEEVKFWEEYLKKETQIYNEILNNKMEVVEGTITELAAKFNTSVEYIMGFIDGISESLTEDLTEDKLETIEADSAVKLEIDFEKLYYNMVAVEAHWLYNLQGWNEILPEEKRKEIQKAYKNSKTVVKEDKIGRNDACPCGSGKKYKKCCGK
jgi:preprotein translocase subunit SecA